MSGSLFVVATPIGNLEDISIRAINTLKEVDFIVAEDTRITSRLLKKYNINKSLISFHINNETRKVNKIINYLNEDKKIALVSDAGTPCISDPGYRLISYIKKKHPEIGVISIPGPSASTASLSISGLPSDCFYFIGFLPKKKGRQKKIKELFSFEGSTIIYESPKRILKTLNDLFAILGNRRIFIAREMTKMHEETFYTDLESASSGDIKLKEKGEYVIVVAKGGYNS